MNPHVQRRGLFSGEIGTPICTAGGSHYFPYIIRSAATGEIVFDGYAGELREAVQTVDLYLEYLLGQMITA